MDPHVALSDEASTETPTSLARPEATTETEEARREKHLLVYQGIVSTFETVIAEIPSTSIGNLSVDGLDALRASDLEKARKLFDEVERTSPQEPLGKLGSGWLCFCEGKGDMAITKFAELMDARRGMGEEDTYLLLATSSMKAVQQAR